MFHFSTEGLPKQDRFEIYREQVVRKLFHWDVSRPAGSDCEFGVRVGPSFGPFQNAICEATPVSFNRGEKELGGGTDGFMLVVNRSGSYRVSHAGRDAELDVGAATLVDHSRPVSIHLPEKGACSVMFLDRAALKPLLAQPEAVIGKSISANEPALRLLVNYAAAASDLDLTSRPDLSRTFGIHAVDLVAAAVGACGDALELIANRGMKAGRISAIKAEIIAGASDASLTSGMVAARIGVSERYLRRVLEETGQTFSEHLLESRLQVARRALGDPRQVGKRVSDIAYEAGFGDLSYFNRSFRRRFGDTPTGFRKTRES